MPGANVAVLIMAAGSGRRMGGGLPKQYRPLAGQSSLRRLLAFFGALTTVNCCVCVIDPPARDLFNDAANGLAVDAIVNGGTTRQESVHNGLEALAAMSAPPDIVLIHDAARPLLSAQIVESLIAALDAADAAAPALPVPDTLSAIDGDGFGPEHDRNGLLRRQTPQAFHFQAILAAHRAHAAAAVTDDIALARLAGLKTAIVEGSILLHKLTTEDDTRMLEALLNDGKRASVGNGFDVHAFGPGDHVTLCGVDIGHDHGLIGHSDADVAMHALTDAILGAVGAGDIGQLFPPTDPQWKGAASQIFLERALAETLERGGELESCDVTIICEAPKVGPHREAMRKRLAEILKLNPERINVKATTTERLGFAGRKEGIAAMATATVYR